MLVYEAPFQREAPDKNEDKLVTDDVEEMVTHFIQIDDYVKHLEENGIGSCQNAHSLGPGNREAW